MESQCPSGNDSDPCDPKSDLDGFWAQLGSKSKNSEAQISPHETPPPPSAQKIFDFNLAAFWRLLPLPGRCQGNYLPSCQCGIHP